jgi:hypothetical protein
MIHTNRKTGLEVHMTRYMVLMLTIAAFAGLLSLPIEAVRRLFSHRAPELASDAASAVSGL